MNLASSIALYAGGPGSGCHGPNCGRPRTTEFREGDRVRLLKPVKVYVRSSYDFKTLMPGKIATVIEVLPAVGHQPERLAVSLGPRYEGVGRAGIEPGPAGAPIYVESADVEFHKSAGKPFDPGTGVKSKPVPDDKAISKSDIPTGGRYAVAKPAGEPGESRGVTNYETRQHPLKGQFERTDAVYGFTSTIGHEGHNLKTFVYETPPEREGKGTVVWVHRYSDARTGSVRQTVIGEVNYTDNKFRYSTPHQFEYNNPAKAFKTLRDRYGIQMKMKDWRY